MGGTCMNTIKIKNKNKTLMVAHRGCSGLEQENTNSAFIAAGNRSYFGIETDIHQTIDGKFVLFHDDDTARLAIDRLIIEESTFDTLRNLLLVDKNGNKGRTDIRIPTLEEYIGICKHYEKIAVLEIKNPLKKEKVWEICDKIIEIDYMANVIFISFDYDNLTYIKEKYPQQNVQFLISQFTDDLIDKLLAWNMNLDIYYKALTKENLRLCHENGIVVNCWTVDDLADAERLIEWGVDYITSNILE